MWPVRSLFLGRNCCSAPVSINLSGAVLFLCPVVAVDGLNIIVYFIVVKDKKFFYFFYKVSICNFVYYHIAYEINRNLFCPIHQTAS